MLLQAAASRDTSSGFQAKLSFAHAETIIPLACLLGLFALHVPENSICAAEPAQRRDAMQGLPQLSPESPQPGSSVENAPQCPNEADIGGSTCISYGAVPGSSSSSSSNTSDHLTEARSVECVKKHTDKVQWVPPLPRPPLSRNWCGSMIAPYGANIKFVLHRRTDRQVSMHNTRPIQLLLSF